MLVKRLALCGVLAPIGFVVAFAVFSLITPEYSISTGRVSELGAIGASHALAWNILGFILIGALITAYAWGLRLDLRPAMGSLVVPLLVGISGIGFAGLGLFPAEANFQPSLRTTLHFVMVSVNFLPFILVAFIFAARLRTNDYWKRWFPLSVALGVIAIASFFLPQSIPIGLRQMIGLGAFFVWLFVTGLALLWKPASGKS